MPEYLCEGRIELIGVVFTITADSLAEAKEKARNGKWDSYDADGASTSDCSCHISTIKINE